MEIGICLSFEYRIQWTGAEGVEFNLRYHFNTARTDGRTLCNVARI